MKSFKYNESQKGSREIALSMEEKYPIPIKILDDSGSIVDNYQIVRTKSNKFMMQK